MRMLIDNRDLELLLEKKKKFIGNKVTVDTMIAGISFLLSVFTATYSDWFGIPGIVFNVIIETPKKHIPMHAAVNTRFL